MAFLQFSLMFTSLGYKVLFAHKGAKNCYGTVHVLLFVYKSEETLNFDLRIKTDLIHVY